MNLLVKTISDNQSVYESQSVWFHGMILLTLLMSEKFQIADSRHAYAIMIFAHALRKII
jgi:hypothetical protein